jgi:hypothetical protein
MTPYERNKKYAKAWVLKNKEKHYQYNYKSQKKRLCWRREQKVFLNILLV